MATRIHDIIEIIENSNVESVKLQLLNYKKAAKLAIQFDFQDESKAMPIDQEKILLEYSYELCENDLFSLPYDVVYYTTRKTLSLIDGVLLTFDDTFLCLRDKPLNDLIIINVAVIPNTKKLIYFYTVNFNTKTFDLSGNGNGFDDPKEHINFVKQRGLTFTALLNSPNVELRHTSVSDKLNRIRTKKGKYPIQPVNEVMLKLNNIRYTSSGDPVDGNHSSPRAHWRRGHIRRCPSGIITNVRPCLVALGDNLIPPKPQYKLA
jgi:hypothetical protein